MSPGTFNQTGATALFQMLRQWKPGAGSVFKSTAGTVQITGSPANGAAKKPDYTSGKKQFCNLIVDAGANATFDGVVNANIPISGNFTNNNSSLATSTSATFTFNG